MFTNCIGYLCAFKDHEDDEELLAPLYKIVYEGSVVEYYVDDVTYFYMCRPVKRSEIKFYDTDTVVSTPPSLKRG
jgi:hypothetical protein